jgi:hypothetical protein
MSEKPATVITDVPEQPNLWVRNKKRLIQVAAVTGGVVLGGAYLKRKLSCSCDVNVDDTNDASEQNTDN